MKFLALLLSLHAAPTALAQPTPDTPTPRVERVSSESLTLLGKGLRMKDPEASIVLACTGTPIENSRLQKCDRLRWVLFMSAEEAYYIGGPFMMTLDEHAITEAGLPAGKYKKSLKNKLRETHVYARKSSRNVVRSLLVTAGVGAAVAIFASTTGIGASFVFSTGFFAGWSLFLLTNLYSYITTPQIVMMTNKTKQLSSQDGWNWADSPKKAPAKYFKSLFRQISREALLGRPAWNQANDLLDGTPWDEDSKIIYSLMERLKAQPKFPQQPGYQ